MSTTDMTVEGQVDMAALSISLIDASTSEKDTSTPTLTSESTASDTTLDEEAKRFPYKETLLGKLPAEIKREIFGWILGFDHQIDLTTPRPKNGRVRLWFSNFDRSMREPFETYLHVCTELREEGIEHLLASTTFYSRFSNSARNIPTLFGDIATAQIQRFELNMHFINKTRHEGTWPILLQTIVEKMPNLKRFTFLSDYDALMPPFPQHESGDPAGTVTRHDQERRALLRFGAFLTLRHPALRVMVLPAASGPKFMPNEYRAISRIELCTPELPRPMQTVLKKASPTAAVEQHSDLVMNSTAIRRLKWTELAQRDPATFAHATNAKTSEVPEEHHFNKWIHAKGYLTFEELGHKGLGRRQDVDNLIDLARRDELGASNPPAQRGGRSGGRGAARGGRWRGAGGRGGAQQAGAGNLGHGGGRGGARGGSGRGGAASRGGRG